MISNRLPALASQGSGKATAGGPSAPEINGKRDGETLAVSRLEDGAKA